MNEPTTNERETRGADSQQRLVMRLSCRVCGMPAEECGCNLTAEDFEWNDPDKIYEDEHEERPRKQFCLSCGATHYKEICPECGSDAQDAL